jgi:hypothetical protein
VWLTPIRKNGITPQEKQRYRCKSCGKSFLFLLSYTYRAYIPLLRELIVPMTLNGSGIQHIARVLQMSPTTVLKVLRQATATVSEPIVPPRIKDLEVDEQWSFVGSKKQLQEAAVLALVWPQLAAFVLSRRTDGSCRQLMNKLNRCQL